MKRLIATIAAAAALTVPTVTAAVDHGTPYRTAGLVGCCRTR